MASLETQTKAGVLSLVLGQVLGANPYSIEDSSGNIKILWNENDIPIVRSKVESYLTQKESNGETISVDFLPVLWPKIVIESAPWVAAIFFAGILADRFFFKDY